MTAALATDTTTPVAGPLTGTQVADAAGPPDIAASLCGPLSGSPR